jgi:hypothetical protein
VKIPEVRAEMLECAALIRAGVGPSGEEMAHVLEAWVEELKRRPAVSRTTPRSRPMSKAVRESILILRAQHPFWSHHQIAEAAGVNMGRVSEVLAGFRP